MISVICVVFLLAAVTWGHPDYQTRIPNGMEVMDPCDRNIHWNAVGHLKRDIGEGPMIRNPFGLDFAAGGYSWTQALCQKDSDGDGLSNGAELGDPNCSWQPGQFPEFDSSSHPGLNENTWAC